jgi:hypothetical protein
MESNTIVLFLIIALIGFLSYVIGSIRGYQQGADMIKEVYGLDK